MKTGTETEQYRHECEVRYVLNKPTIQAMNDYLDRVKEKRSPAKYKKLADDVRAELEKRRASGKPKTTR